MKIPAHPFRILALAPLAPRSQAGGPSRLLTVDLSSLDEALAELGPRLSVEVPRDLCPSGWLTIEISALADFKPSALLAKEAYLSQLAEAGRFIDQAAAGLSAADVFEQLMAKWPALPLRAPQGASAKEPASSAADPVDAIMAAVAMPGESGSVSRPAESKGLRAQVNRLLSALLAHLFADPAFRTHLSAWRGVETLLKQGGVKEGQGIELLLANTDLDSLEQVLADLPLAVDELPSLMLVDLPFDASPRSLELMEKMADFAGSQLLPCACWITPGFFHLRNWEEIEKLPYLKHFLEDPAYAKWRGLAEQPAGQWLLVAANRFAYRPAFGPDNPPRKVPAFDEDQALWLSPVWAIGALSAQSVGQFGWPSRLTDYTQVRLRDLPLLGTEGRSASTEMLLSEDRILSFADAGLCALVGPMRKDFAFLPKDTTVAGGSFAFQMFTARLLNFLFRCQAELGEELKKGDLGAQLKAVLEHYWEKTGHKAPEDMEIEAGAAEADQSIPLRISLTPPRAVLPTQQRLEFTLSW